MTFDHAAGNGIRSPARFGAAEHDRPEPATAWEAHRNWQESVTMAGNSYKDREDQIVAVGDAWKRYAADKTLAGLTLEQFQQRATECRQALRRVEDLENQLLGARNERERLFREMKQLIMYIKNAVSGDPSLGPDSSMYEAMGYVRTSDRKSGLKRPRKGEDEETKGS
ncbi:MAG TPA: hypothetical protein PLP08_09205 [Plasticicumulans sp.]|uniref:hypothetical protein n=1 Tax=Plasticicumulans sp. TaxID=2307179 RepID=UPI000FACAE28|nr:hypothetical protein [Plasticicumulans sp.]RTK95445.1 MAG: hypothetical protein EKK65_15405 [Xanthomonadales bacterium]HMW41476.1 hypothetical protein [Plasticicumulans sp.]HMZ10310.1 hypothetical protein [Plasticicumulans sp.]HNF65884.1 hypothetical protein [Plasticicumulans sp.]HNG49758.1 hypothetical protein [Plasticicumulans sp.]